MATLFTRNCFTLRPRLSFHRQRFGRVYARCDSNTARTGYEYKRGRTILRNCLSVLLAGTGATCGALLYLLDRSVEATSLALHPPSYPWQMDGLLTSLDHSAVRRGWQVYRTVCSTCHSVRYLRFLDLIDVTHTENEVKAITSEFEVNPNCTALWIRDPAPLRAFGAFRLHVSRLLSLCRAFVITRASTSAGPT